MQLTEFPEWHIHDSSKLSDANDCLRMYFFKHILGWQVDAPMHDAYFGESFHKGREHQLIHGYDDIQGAYDAFIKHYRKEFTEESDELYKPKTPINALNAFIRFFQERSSDLIDNEVVELDGSKMTEISGTVPVDEKRVLYYRMDSIMRRKEDGKIFSWDHKSTKRFSRFWREAFHLGLQNGTYTHCMYCLFPIEDVLGVEFCGTTFEYLKKGSKARPAGFHISFERVPAFKTADQMNVWLWNIVDLLDRLEYEMDRLSDCKDADTVMMAFPMNPGSCTKYFGCAFHDFCLAWPNPLRQCDEPPLGFIQKFWDPSKMETTNKRNLEWGGEDVTKP